VIDAVFHIKNVKAALTRNPEGKGMTEDVFSGPVKLPYFYGIEIPFSFGRLVPILDLGRERRDEEKTEYDRRYKCPSKHERLLCANGMQLMCHTRFPEEHISGSVNV
jgi:hypothetical protein